MVCSVADLRDLFSGVYTVFCLLSQKKLVNMAMCYCIRLGMRTSCGVLVGFHMDRDYLASEHRMIGCMIVLYLLVSKYS